MVLAKNCIVVKGAFNSSFVDMQRKKLVTILTEEMNQYCNEEGDFDVNFVKEKNREFYTFLENNECLVPESVKQIDIPTEWDFPGIISNAVICIGTNNYLNSDITIQLDNLGVESVAILATRKFDLEKNLNYFNGTNITSISVYGTLENIGDEKLIKNIKSNRLKTVYVFESKLERVDYTDEGKHIFYSKEKFDSIKGCGFIHLDLFSLDIVTYTESLNHNSCLNRKISIDAEGYIKNCPSMKESFGNIKDTTLAEAIEKSGFKKYWDINKDKIHVCKDCEFRYICTDCRAYVEDPEDILSKPLKCGYNPYSGEWSEWSTNPLKKSAIKYYGMEN